ncbi:MAG TPA: inosine/xanthosine triphosphatase [Bacteroidota bacterium]|nr:inosine/xanthosine triphosphatase [Bacteroidota bacterium]
MIIAIASTRGPKVDAVKKVVRSIRRYLGPPSSVPNYIMSSIGGDVSMPRTLEQLLGGARKRAMRLQEHLQSKKKTADFYIGLEGGFHTVRHSGKEQVFLQSWAYVSDGAVGYFGSSGNVLVPERIAREVMRKGRDLSEVIDEVASQSDVRSKQGTWGVLTRDLLTRQRSFEIALTAAFAPFYNPSFYGAKRTSNLAETGPSRAETPQRTRSAKRGTDRKRR